MYKRTKQLKNVPNTSHMVHSFSLSGDRPLTPHLPLLYVKGKMPFIQTCLVMLPCSRASMCNRDNSCGMNAFRRGNVTSEKQSHSMNTHAGDHCTHFHRTTKDHHTIQSVSELIFSPGHLCHKQPQVIHGVLVRLLSAEVIQRPHVLEIT